MGRGSGLALAPAPVLLAVGWRAGKGWSGGHLAEGRGAGAGGARSAWGSGGGQAVEEQAEVAAAQFAGAGRVGHADRGAALQYQAEVVGHYVGTEPSRGLGPLSQAGGQGPGPLRVVMHLRGGGKGAGQVHGE